MFMITEAERLDAINHADEIAFDLTESSSRTQTLFKDLSNLCSLVVPNCVDEKLESLIFNDKEKTKLYITQLYKGLMTYFEQVTLVKEYTTGDLSKFFGVSITTINKWVDEERFKNAKRSAPNKQLRVSENDFWRDSRGSYIQVKNIVKEYEQQQKEDEKFTKEDERNALLKQIDRLKKKHGGSYEDTLMVKEDKTSEDYRDEAEWKFLLGKVNND
jgi:DNA-binding transcriptional MerR regulator